MWKNTIQLDRPQMATWLMRISYWITQATDTRSMSVRLIAFPLQQWLHNRATFLCLYVHCLPFYNFWMEDK